MAILSIQTSQTGEAGVLPSYASILTTDTEATVLTAGYLNHAVQNGASFALPCIAKISTKSSATADYQVGWYQITHTGSNWSAVPAGNPGDVVLPTVANRIIHATNTTGTLSTDAASVVNLGNITAGASTGVSGLFQSFPGTAANGALILQAVNAGGAFATTISNGTTGQAQVISIPDSGATTANFIISKFATTQNITVGALQVNAGVISSGISTGGTAGGFIAYPATTTNGSLRLTPVGNVGNFAATISNIVGLGQATVYTIPDPGAATATFLLSAAASGQTITGGLTITTGALGVSAGAITSGLSAGGFVGLLKAFPTTATSGFIALQAAANATGNFGLTLSNGLAQAQATVLTIPDVGAATGFLNPQTVTANLTPASVIITKDITLGFAGLAAAAQVTIQAALATAQFKVRDIQVNYGASGLSGGGGDRLVVITDGTTVYNNAGITAALLGTPINTVWGGTGNPLAGTVAQNTSTVAGAKLYAVYSGGAADYTAGSVVITVTYERVA